MQRAPRYSLRTSVFFAVLGAVAVLSVVATSADAAATGATGASVIAGKQELQYDAPDVEKILHELNRYLYRQRQRHVQQQLDEQQPEEEDDSSELSHLTHRDDLVDALGADKHRYQRRLSWPFWSAKTAARAAAAAPSEGGPTAPEADAPVRPYEKRNSELINSLLGLPRIMKVVG